MFRRYKGDRVAFVDGKVLVWGKDSSFEKAKVIGVREGRLYRVITPSPQALVHMEIKPIELWHRRYGHIHYKTIPSLSQMVKGIPNIKEDHEEVCKGCALGKNTRNLLQAVIQGLRRY